MTWLEAAIVAGKKWGLSDDIKESYHQHKKGGASDEDAAHWACYDWDIFIPLEIIDKITEQ